MRFNATPPLQYSITPYPITRLGRFLHVLFGYSLGNKSVNRLTREHVKQYMKKMCAILAVALLSPYVASQANAGPISEGPLHCSARHVRNAAETAANVARTAARTI